MRPVIQSAVPTTPSGLAVASMLCATAFIGGMTLLVKVLGTDTLSPALHPLQVSHGRFFFAWIIITCVVLAIRPRFRNPQIGLHLGRAMIAFTGALNLIRPGRPVRCSDLVRPLLSGSK